MTKKIMRRGHEGTEAVSAAAKKAGNPEIPMKDTVSKIPVDNLQGIEHPARVRVEGSVTKNMGDYNSIRVGVIIEMPCAPDDKSITRMYHYLSDKVSRMTQEELDLASEELDDKLN